MSNFIQLQITFPNKNEAEKIAQSLVESHKVACVQIIGPIQSFYYWKEKLENDEEFLLLAKTRSSYFNMLSEEINLAHSYECPQIVALPIEYISPDYESWLENQID